MHACIFTYLIELQQKRGQSLQYIYICTYISIYIYTYILQSLIIRFCDQNLYKSLLYYKHINIYIYIIISIFPIYAISYSCDQMIHTAILIWNGPIYTQRYIHRSLSEMQSLAGAAASDTPAMKGGNVPHPKFITYSQQEQSLQIRVCNFGKWK